MRALCADVHRYGIDYAIFHATVKKVVMRKLLKANTYKQLNPLPSVGSETADGDDFFAAVGEGPSAVVGSGTPPTDGGEKGGASAGFKRKRPDGGALAAAASAPAPAALAVEHKQYQKKAAKGSKPGKAKGKEQAAKYK